MNRSAESLLLFACVYRDVSVSVFVHDCSQNNDLICLLKRRTYLVPFVLEYTTISFSIIPEGNLQGTLYR